MTTRVWASYLLLLAVLPRIPLSLRSSLRLAPRWLPSWLVRLGSWVLWCMAFRRPPRLLRFSWKLSLSVLCCRALVPASSQVISTWSPKLCTMLRSGLSMALWRCRTCGTSALARSRKLRARTPLGKIMFGFRPSSSLCCKELWLTLRGFVTTRFFRLPSTLRACSGLFLYGACHGSALSLPRWLVFFRTLCVLPCRLRLMRLIVPFGKGMRMRPLMLLSLVGSRRFGPLSEAGRPLGMSMRCLCSKGWCLKADVARWLLLSLVLTASMCSGFANYGGFRPSARPCTNLLPRTRLVNTGLDFGMRSSKPLVLSLLSDSGGPHARSSLLMIRLLLARLCLTWRLLRPSLPLCRPM